MRRSRTGPRPTTSTSFRTFRATTATVALAELVNPSTMTVWVPDRSATKAPASSTWPMAPGATIPSAGIPKVANWTG